MTRPEPHLTDPPARRRHGTPSSARRLATNGRALASGLLVLAMVASVTLLTGAARVPERSSSSSATLAGYDVAGRWHRPHPTRSPRPKPTSSSTAPSTGPTTGPTTAAPSTAPPTASTTAAPPTSPTPTTSPRPAPTTTAPPPPPAPTTAAPPPGAGSASAADAVLTTINAARAAAGVPALSVNPGLVSSASAHNRAMAAADQLSHQLPGEAGLGARVSAAGVPWSMCAENIGYSTATGDPTGAAVGLTNSMLAETPPNDGHRQNILSPDLTQIGIEVYVAGGKVWLTQDFARP